MITEEEKQNILREIIKNENFRTEIKAGEFSKIDLITEQGLTRHQADTLIEKLVREKKIISRPALRKGKPCTAYSFTEK